VVMGGNSKLEGLHLDGVTGAGFAAVHFPSGINEAIVSNSHASGVPFGILVDAEDKDNRAEQFSFISGTGDAMVKVNAGAHMTMSGCSAPDASTLTDVALVDGVGAIIHMIGGHIDGANVTNGIHVKNGGVAYVSATHLHSFTNAFRVGTGGGKLYAMACDILASGTYDLLIDDSDGEMFIGGSVISREKVSFATGSSVKGMGVNRTIGDEGTQIYGEMAVGTPEQPGESSVGEGDSYTRDMTVFSFDGTATWVNNSVAAASEEASTFSLWQALAAGNVAYFIHPTNRFNGLKIVGGGTAADLTGGTIIWEYWNGSAWTAFNIMASDADEPKEAKAQNAFNITTTSDQIRFNMSDLTDANWVTTTVNAVTGFAVRVRIATGPITTVPILQRTKLGSNRIETDRLGAEAFGTAEDRHTFWEGTGEDLSAPSGGVNAPTDLDVTISTNISYRQARSLYADGSDIRRAGTKVEVPDGIDTSRPVRLDLALITDGVSTNNIIIDVYGAPIQDGDVLGALAQIKKTITVAGTGTSQKEFSGSAEFDISDLEPGGSFGFSINPQRSTDTNPDDLGVLSLRLSGFVWRI